MILAWASLCWTPIESIVGYWVGKLTLYIKVLLYGVKQRKIHQSIVLVDMTVILIGLA